MCLDILSYFLYFFFLWLAASCQPCSTCLHIPLCTVMLTLIFNSTAYCHAHSFIPYILYLIFNSFCFMYTSLVLYFSIFARSMERTRLSFHCWLYNLCIVLYVTNKTWNLNSARAVETISALLQTHRSWNAPPDLQPCAVWTLHYIMMSAEKIRTAYTLQTDVNLALCVCVRTRCECAGAHGLQLGERASADWFKHWQELKRKAIYKL